VGSVALLSVAVVGFAVGPAILARWMHCVHGRLAHGRALNTVRRVGAFVLSEPVTVFTGLGVALILIGCWLVTNPERRPAAAEAESLPTLEPEGPLEGLPL
jgi:drug/metabolite transporter (DMT)-like permease